MTGGHEAIALSVLMHVTWNLIARHQPRASEPLWWVLLGHLVLIAPWGLYRFVLEAQWSGQLLLLLAASALANVRAAAPGAGHRRPGPTLWRRW